MRWTTDFQWPKLIEKINKHGSKPEVSKASRIFEIACLDQFLELTARDNKTDNSLNQHLENEVNHEVTETKIVRKNKQTRKHR